jgi:hypothetical protein
MNVVTKKEILLSVLAMKYQLETSRKDLVKHLQKTDQNIKLMKDLLQKLDIDTYTEHTTINPVELKKKGVI